MTTTKSLITNYLSLIFLSFSLVVTPAEILASEPHEEDDHEQKHGGGEHGEEEGFRPGEMIMHHIKDDYSWHFFDVGSFHATLYLPVIIYNTETGLDVFSSSHLFHSEDHTYKGYEMHHGDVKAVNGAQIYDFSITKNVFSMLISVAIMFLIFIPVANRYKKAPRKAPKGLQNVVEVIVLFIRDEVARPLLGENKYQRYFPYLITVFFFIWINNLLGLLPGAANLTGNIAVTGALALITFLITSFSGNKHYWAHILWPPVPFALKFILIPVEFLGIFTKPVALMIRLFANITAGHILILSIISLIFIFGSQSMGVGFGVSPVSVAFATFLYFLELLVAAIQAYVFTMLSAVFIGSAIEEHH